MGAVIFTILLIACLSMRPVASGGVFSTRARNASAKVKPCEDFYKYMCDKWMKTAVPHGVANWTKLEEETTPVKHKIAKYLGKAVKQQDINPIKWAKIHFQACTNEGALNEIGMRPLTKIVKSVGGGEWNILEEIPKKDWVAVHNAYSQITGKGALFTIEVGPDENLIKNVLIISPTEELFLRHISKSNQEDLHQYEEFLTNIWAAYSKEQGTYTQIAVKNAIEGVLRFREEIMEKRNLIRGEPRMIVMKLSVFQELTRRHIHKKHLDWQRLLQSTFRNLGNFTFEGSTNVYIRQLNYLKLILGAIGSTEGKVLLNHVHFHFLERFIQHTSPGMNALFYQVLKRPLPKRSITCITSNAMNKIVNYIYVRKFLTKDDISTATKVVYEVRENLKRQISGTTWLEKEAARLIRKIKKMNVVIGYDSWYGSMKNVIDYYSGMNISKNYLTNILDFETMSYKDALRKLGTLVTKEFDEPSTDPLDVSATYNYQTNTIVIPAGLFHWPILEEPQVLADYYGGLGTMVGNALSRSLDSQGRQYDEKRKRGKWWSNKTMNAYNERLQCYSDSLKETILKAKLNFTPVDRNDYTDEIVAEYMGIVAAFATYSSEIRASETLFFNFENEYQRFFRIYARRHCEAIGAHFLAEMGRDAHLPHQLRVNAAVSNMQAFADTFGCKEGDPMNSSHKCELLDESSIRNIV